MTKPIIFIDGDQGTTGLQIHALLANRTDIDVSVLPGADRKNTTRRAEALNASDIAILCLPDEAARVAVSMIENPRVRVIDASSAHRTEPGWVYGFPELSPGQAVRIAQATRVTNPGCYPTGAIGLLGPLVSAGLLPADYPLSIHAVSGYSGGGRPAVEQHERSEGSPGPAFQVYGLGLTHKHVPEIQRYAQLELPPIFVPAYGSYRQGIVLTIPLQTRLLPAGVDADAVQACLEQHYASHTHVRVLPRDESADPARIDPQRLNGTNDMELAVYANPERGHILLTAVFDNLGKGAAGAAVQNLDLLLKGAHGGQ